jgi:hypothetical protein
MGNGIDLPSVFQDKIIPLLQEYFFGDYGKIGLVLGRGFVSKETTASESTIFARFDYEDSPDLAQREVYRIIWPDEMKKDGQFKEALRLLMNR